MPKTRSKRKKKAKAISTSAAEEVSSKDDFERYNAESVDAIGETGTINTDDENVDTDEAPVNTELQAELKRLQDEYKRQKEITNELERERERYFEGSVQPSPPKSSQSASVKPILSFTDYPEISTGEPGFDDEYTDPALTKQINDSVSNLTIQLDELRQQISSKADNERLSELNRLEETCNKLADSVLGFSRDVARLQKEVEKTDQKLTSVLQDLGFEESLDINKVPNNILVMVYETILNDAVLRIQHNRGAQDTETTVTEIIEDIRKHSSGGELFIYERNKIRLPDLRQYLAKKLISPKQIHITYKSILERLLEAAPGHEPKNFKAMVKVKSQEYSVTTATKLDLQFESISDEVEKFKTTFNKFIDNYKERETERENEFQELKTELEAVGSQITELKEQIEELPNAIEEKLMEKMDEPLTGRINEILEDKLSKLSVAPMKDTVEPTEKDEEEDSETDDTESDSTKNTSEDDKEDTDKTTVTETDDNQKEPENEDEDEESDKETEIEDKEPGEEGKDETGEEGKDESGEEGKDESGEEGKDESGEGEEKDKGKKSRGKKKKEPDYTKGKIVLE